MIVQKPLEEEKSIMFYNFSFSAGGNEGNKKLIVIVKQEEKKFFVRFESQVIYIRKCNFMKI